MRDEGSELCQPQCLAALTKGTKQALDPAPPVKAKAKAKLQKGSPAGAPEPAAVGDDPDPDDPQSSPP
eukprot:11223684-Lingulodinium_polyedra.AAC.1